MSKGKGGGETRQGIKKKKYLQKYKPEWEADVHFRGWLAPSRRSLGFATCTACDKDLNITSGKDALYRHLSSNIHQKRTETSTRPAPDEQGDQRDDKIQWKQGDTGLWLADTDQNTGLFVFRNGKPLLEYPLFKNWLSLKEEPTGLVAMCTVCDRTFSSLDYKILKKHSLCRSHRNQMGTEPNDEMCLYRISSKLWNHFVRLDSDTARCKYCKQELSHENSTSELEEHLNSEHPNVKYADTQVRSTEVISKALKIPTSKKRKLKAVLTPPIIRKDDEDSYMDYEELEEIIIETSDASVPEDISYDDPLPQTSSNVQSKSNRICENIYNQRPQTYECKSNSKASIQEEDSIEHFGKYMMSLLHELPKNLAYKVQLELASVLLNALTKYSYETKSANETGLDILNTNTGLNVSNAEFNTSNMHTVFVRTINTDVNESVVLEEKNMDTKDPAKTKAEKSTVQPGMPLI